MKHTKRRAFFLALGISLFLFITAVGFVVVDYQGRRLSFGESQPPLILSAAGESLRPCGCGASPGGATPWRWTCWG